MLNSVWITWEQHQRTRSIAKELDIKLVELIYQGNIILRYLYCTFRTIFVIINSRPNVLFVQNPSIILTMLTVLLKPIFRYKLVVDRHSSFRFGTRSNPKFLQRLFNSASDFTITKADLTIVTNDPLAKFIEVVGGKPFVLPDPIPDFPKIQTCGEHFVMITSMGIDDPIEEIISVFRDLPNEDIYITGNYSKAIKNGNVFLCDLPENVTLTGFLPNDEYVALISSAKAIIVITSNELTLTCGAYEATALEKPMILGNTRTTIEHFSRGAVYSGSSTSALKNSVEILNKDIIRLGNEAKILKKELLESWSISKERLLVCLKNL